MAEVKKKTIAFVAGYSAGHILPCIALHKQKYHNKNVLFFTTTNKLDTQLLKKQSSFINVFIPLHRKSRMRIHHYFLLLWHLMCATIKSVYYLHKHKSERIITTGSFIALPICYAARLLRIPIDVYELNAHPGRTNKHIAFFATNVFVCFKRTQQQLLPLKTTLINYPQTIYPIKKQNKTSDKPTILVLGGSQGSTSLNSIICKLLASNTELQNNVYWIHQTGDGEYQKISNWYKKQKINCTVMPFADDLTPYIAQADLVICRAGAGTLFSLIAYNKPCITIPLSTVAENHQLLNAEELTKKHHNLITILEQQMLIQNKAELYNQIKKKIQVTPK